MCLTAYALWQCSLLALETRHLFCGVTQICLNCSVLTDWLRDGSASPFKNPGTRLLKCWVSISSPSMVALCIITCVKSLSWFSLVPLFSISHISAFLCHLCCLILQAAASLWPIPSPNYGQVPLSQSPAHRKLSCLRLGDNIREVQGRKEILNWVSDILCFYF